MNQRQQQSHKGRCRKIIVQAPGTQSPTAAVLIQSIAVGRIRRTESIVETGLAEVAMMWQD
jgi:hypothetical protein